MLQNLGTLASTPPHVLLLRQLAAVRNSRPFRNITAGEDELLRELIARWHYSNEITLADVIRLRSGISAPTAYRRLLGLRNKRFVQFVDHPDDRRKKFVCPSPLAKDYIRELQLAVFRAMHVSALS